MNCKPGDLAHVIVLGEWYGSLVGVVHAAPSKDFRLPDGQKHCGCEPGAWVIEALGKPFRAPIETRNGVLWRDTRYGVARDSQLRPIRDPGDDARDETLDWLPVPAQEHSHV